MTMIKRGTCTGPVKVSLSRYVCPKCGHQDVAQDDSCKPMKCSACGESMELAGYSSEAQEN